MIPRVAIATAVVALGAAAPASAFIGPFTGVGTGTSDHNDHQESSDQTFQVNSHHAYGGRFTYSFKIDAFGSISGTGTGAYQSASWHLDGRNGDKGPFSCEVPVMTPPRYKVEVDGRVVNGRAHLQFRLDDSHEDNDSMNCGADYQANETHSTYLAGSLQTVQENEILVDPDHPSIGPLRRLTETGDNSNKRIVLDEWDISIHPPPGDQPQDGGPFAPPGTDSRPPGKDETSICTIMGTAHADRLRGTRGNDVICGFGGGDRINGRGGNDLVYGGPGGDRITGGGGRDVLYGNFGNDSFSTRDRKKDRAHGGFGKDSARADKKDRLIAIERASRR
jgi:RTX calcium-binding nonapeptide repeat (4 copies)